MTKIHDCPKCKNRFWETEPNNTSNMCPKCTALYRATTQSRKFLVYKTVKDFFAEHGEKVPAQIIYELNALVQKEIVRYLDKRKSYVSTRSPSSAPQNPPV